MRESLLEREEAEKRSQICGMTVAIVVLSLLVGAAIVIGSVALWKAYNESAASSTLAPDPVYHALFNWFPQQGRDRYGTRYFPGFEGSSTANTLTGTCNFNTETGTGGITAGIISDSGGNMYFGDLGDTSSLNAKAWSITQNCTRNWSQNMADLISSNVPPYFALESLDYPWSNVAADMTIATKNDNTEILVFADTGTWLKYNETYCLVLPSSSKFCGVRMYSLDPLRGGTLLGRSAVTYTITESSLTMTSGFNAIGSMIFGGLGSVQSWILGQPSNPDYSLFSVLASTFSVDIEYINLPLAANPARLLINNQFSAGATINSGNAPIDDEFNIYFGSTSLLNWSASDYTCFQQTGGSMRKCLPPGTYANSIVMLNLYQEVSTTSGFVYPPFVRTPEGINAWNNDCLNHPPGVGNCPINATKGYGFYTNLMIVPKRQLVIAKSSSGGVYAYNTKTLDFVGQAYAGPPSQGFDANSMATDGDYVYLNVPNPDKLSYIATDKTLRCDGAHVKISLIPDETFMKVIKRVPNQCSRASTGCPAVIPDTSMLEWGFTIEELTYTDVTTTPTSGLQIGQCLLNSDIRNSPDYSMSVGGPVVTDRFVYTNAMDGYMYALSKETMEMASRSSTRCPVGTPIGGITLHSNQIAATSCGGIFPGGPRNAIADTNIMLARMTNN